MKKRKGFGKTQTKQDGRLNRLQILNSISFFSLRRNMTWWIAYRNLREMTKWTRRCEEGKSDTYLEAHKAKIPQGIKKNCLKTSASYKRGQLISLMLLGINKNYVRVHEEEGVRKTNK